MAILEIDVGTQPLLTTSVRSLKGHFLHVRNVRNSGQKMDSSIYSWQEQGAIRFHWPLASRDRIRHVFPATASG